MRRTQTRLDRLERSQGAGNGIERLAKLGVFYDELTPEQRQLYAAFKSTTSSALESVELMVNGTLHFVLEPNGTADSVADVSAWIEDLMRVEN